ncbi:MAG: hypothetical protein RL644_103, partial [Actinomycetota bacterium]
CAGAREVLVAYNVWLTGCTLDETRAVADRVRRPGNRQVNQVHADLGVRAHLQPERADAGPRDAFDAVRAECGGAVSHAELVGLVPQRVLESIPQGRWEELDLSADRTIEARIGALGMGAG